MRIVVLGGYGNFGVRICRALMDADAEIIAAGREPDQGHGEARLDAKIGKARIDIFDPQLEADLRKLRPAIVIHCAGPFQGQDYRVALAAINVGSHYIDLADGRAFVINFADAIDSVAKSAGLLAVTGASTLPALSSAVVNALKNQFTSIEEIQISIAPAQRSPRGTATLRAVLSYVGRYFKWLEQGTWRQVYGWQELRRMHFADLGKRWAAACDVPDLALFPQYYPGVQTVQFRASLEFGIEHFMLAIVAGLRRNGLPVPIERWAAAFDKCATLFDSFGRAQGGMLVSVTGNRSSGQRASVEWHLTAGFNEGPEIPCMPAILLARKLVQGNIQVRGAMPCIGLLTLDEFLPEFRHWNIHTRIKEAPL